MPDTVHCVTVAAEGDILSARQQGREMARVAGFSLGDQTVIAAAISEIARNILIYAQRGEVRESSVPYGGSGWIGGSPEDYDREYCVDLAQLRAFLRTTQPKVAEALALDEVPSVRLRDADEPVGPGREETIEPADRVGPTGRVEG